MKGVTIRPPKDLSGGKLLLQQQQQKAFKNLKSIIFQTFYMTPKVESNWS